MLLCWLQYSLWGNKTDLSMLVDVAHMDSSAAAAAAAVGTSSGSGSGSSNIIVDETDALWEYLKAKAAAAQGPGAEGLQCAVPRIDIILDNAGGQRFSHRASDDVHKARCCLMAGSAVQARTSYANTYSTVQSIGEEHMGYVPCASARASQQRIHDMVLADYLTASGSAVQVVLLRDDSVLAAPPS
jgi:hypothetical protein